MKAFRLLALILCISTALFLFGCNRSGMGLSPFEPVGQQTSGEIITPETIETTITEEATAIPENEFTFQEESEQASAPEESASFPEQTTPDIEETLMPVETTPPPTASGCNHLHVQEAASMDMKYGELYGEEREQMYLGNLEYCRTNRLVIAYGGLNLRDKPSSQNGVPIALIPDGEIITVSHNQDGWSYATYNGISGWCSMEYLFDPYMYPTAGGSPIAQGIVNVPEGIRLYTDRHCDNKDTVSTVVPYGEKILLYGGIASYKSIYGFCSEEGLIIEPWTGYSEPENNQSSTDYKSTIVNSWMAAWRRVDQHYADFDSYEYLSFYGLEFYADGTFVNSCLELHNTYYSHFPGEDGWYVPGMGFPSFTGTYTIEGNVLTLSYYDDLSLVYVTDTYTIDFLDDERLVLNDSTYVNLDCIDVEFDEYDYIPYYLEICAALGVSTSVG